MQTYNIETPDGAAYKVEAENDAQAQSAIKSYLPTEPGVLDKAMSNALPDVGQMVQGLAAHANTWAPFLGGDPIPAVQSLVQQGQGILANPKQAAESAIRPIAHPVDYFQEHPIQQALNVAGAGQLALRGMGAALNAVPATENLVPTIERMANNQTLKGFGGTMGQLKQMAEGQGGREALDQAARYAREQGLSDVFTTDIGREKLLQNLLKITGGKVGALREQAGAASPEIISKALNNPNAKMGEYLGEGMASGELPMVDKAIADVKRIGGMAPTNANVADAATYINKQAAGTKLYQPVNAATDFANALSDENNQEIAQSLGPDKAKQYVDALSEQQKLHPLEHLQERGELRQAGGRGGIGFQLVQKYFDELGYRLDAKAAAAVHDALVSNNLPITKIAVMSQLASLGKRPEDQAKVSDLIEQLKQKIAGRQIQKIGQ